MADAPDQYSGRLVPLKAYPTYGYYEAIMKGLARRYPNRCALENWGTLPSGRKILVLRISENVARTGGKPRLLLTAAMHGDETAGYAMLLRLAEELLRSSNPLLRSTEIFINPLGNPDGAYAGGDHTLARARRGNANGVDLNRNYPDPDDGSHPDGNDYQPETHAFMAAAERLGFDLAINLHGGAELFNYPWDTYRNRHPDTRWWQRVSRDFATRAQRASGPARYFTDRHDGVTNGHDWYPIAGSRQDYMNYYHRAREATAEVTVEKQYPAEKLPTLWRHFSPALLGYLNEARFGLHGSVHDARTGRPVRALVSIPAHDRMNSEVYSDATYGDFHRFLAAGTYRVFVSAEGYRTRSFLVTIEDGKRAEVSVSLDPLPGVDARKR